MGPPKPAKTPTMVPEKTEYPHQPVMSILPIRPWGTLGGAWSPTVPLPRQEQMPLPARCCWRRPRGELGLSPTPSNNKATPTSCWECRQVKSRKDELLPHTASSITLEAQWGSGPPPPSSSEEEPSPQVSVGAKYRT